MSFHALIEAMACSLPIIVTDVGGSKELVKGNGSIVKKNCPEALRQAILRYDHKLLREHGHASVMIARRMDWKRVAEKYYRYYHELA
jgi:glycosyltransferase involved in cell wall biosynthesis